VTNVNEAPKWSSGTALTFAENGTGTVYTSTASDEDAGSTLSYSIGGVDSALFNINNSTGVLTFKAAPNFEAPADAGANNVYDITVTASDGSLSTPLTLAITVTDVQEVAQSVIDLGAYGKLIAPVQVDGGKWYYFWDRSGNGIAGSTGGTLNGGLDTVSHNELDNLFNKDAAGVMNTTVKNADNLYGTTDVYRYGTINGVQLALPTIGGTTSLPYGPNGIQAAQPGTAIGSSTKANGSNDVNANYNDLLAIWDAYNGTGTGTTIATAVPGWPSQGYAAATPTTGGHSLLNTDTGVAMIVDDNFLSYAVLQVFFNTTAPVITSAAIASFAENATGTVYTASATDADTPTTLSYSIAGTDAALFNINTATGAVSFKASPNFEAPTDSGANNVYDVKVSVTDGSFVTSKDVAISVTNVNEAPVLSASAAVNYAENGKGVVYTAIATDVDAGTTLTYSIGGADVALFNINANNGQVSFKTSPNFEAPTDAGANNVYDITVTAKDSQLNSNTQAVAISVTDVLVEPGQSVIDLASYGKLIAPVQVDDGNWYYFWDRSGNGIAGGSGGTFNGGFDTITHDVLDSLFTQDINGTVNASVKNIDGNYGTTDLYRYATLNGVKLALPTIGIVGTTGAQPGTAVGAATAANGSNAVNNKYNDLLAVWDAYNGTTTGSNLSGTPASWQANNYWAATDASSFGHATVNLSSGTLTNFADTQTYFVVLQVLG
jgi:serralysin